METEQAKRLEFKASRVPLRACQCTVAAAPCVAAITVAVACARPPLSGHRQSMPLGHNDTDATGALPQDRTWLARRAGHRKASVALQQEGAMALVKELLATEVPLKILSTDGA